MRTVQITNNKFAKTNHFKALSVWFIEAKYANLQ